MHKIMRNMFQGLGLSIYYPKHEVEGALKHKIYKNRDILNHARLLACSLD